MFDSLEALLLEPQNYSLQVENQLREMKRLITGRLKVASDEKETWYRIASNSVGFEEGD